MSIKMIRPTAESPTPDPNEHQKRASIPQHDVWVAASAGSGKTKVLTDRVLRLLLPDPDGKWTGSAPHKILCITFTKAAAALMAIRIQKRLGKWAMMNEIDLIEDLTKLTGAPPSPEMMTAARQLFTKVLDVPGGMAIMTIHAFCQSTLGRFPLESGLTPGFRVLDETRSKELLSTTILSLVTDIEGGKRKDLESPFNHIALSTDFDTLKSTLISLLDKSRRLTAFLDKNGTGETLRKNLLRTLGLDEDANGTEILHDFVTTRPEEKLREVAQCLGTSKTKTNKTIGQAIADWLALPPSNRAAQLDRYRLGILNKDNIVRKIYDGLGDSRPDITALFESEREALLEILDKLAILNQCQLTSDLLTISAEIAATYEKAKRHRNALDFTDLIAKTRELLEQKGEDWVHFKLDEGIDHILVDEAQDTNIDQWKIIEYLSAELQSGWGRETKSPRSLFVVGDKKQSIFSFHGADPEAFTRMRHFFEKRSKEAEREFDIVNLETSFRTTKPVLSLVDKVFENPVLTDLLGLESDEHLVHYSFRENEAGKVELWNVIKKGKEEKGDSDATWLLPFSEERAGQSTSTPHDLTTRIANRIKQMIEGKEIIPSTGCPAQPRDILVLVRTRTGSFIPNLVRQLKIYKIAVSGIDRMTLRDQIAVEDCLSLARFARLPKDDLSLACLLKSPFIRLDEDELMTLAIQRKKGETLWDSAQRHLPEKTLEWLRKRLEIAATLSPFNFFNETLSCPCPYDPDGSARRSFATCLGPDCIDPLDEFLGYCLTIEQDGINGLEDFVTHMEKSDFQIKRESEDTEKESGNQIRIMTVHASKGLEAPVVFLPDTTSLPNASKTPRLLWVKEGESLSFPLWTDQTQSTCALYKDARAQEKDKEYAEYLRLLYVALTRARDHLYIAGELRKEDFNKTSSRMTWYQLVESAFSRLDDIKTDGDKRIYELKAAITQKHTPELVAKPLQMPDWLPRPPATEAAPRHFIQPSLLGRTDDAALSPLQSADNYRFERGILTHRLFQFLPDIAADHWEKAAKLFLEKSGKNLPEQIRQDIVKEVLAVLNDPVFAPVFGPNSLAEVSVTGEIGEGRILSGQIDRLVVEKDRILIVDFKSNRPSPANESEIPQTYRDQLRAYKYAISMIYRDMPIECALLWTDKAILMPVTV